MDSFVPRRVRFWCVNIWDLDWTVWERDVLENNFLMGNSSNWAIYFICFVRFDLLSSWNWECSWDGYLLFHHNRTGWNQENDDQNIDTFRR